MPRLMVLSVLVLATLVPASAGQTEKDADVRIHLTRGPLRTTPGQPPVLSGYAETIGGQTIDYHSSHPDAVTALLVRAKEGVDTIAWRTEPIPANSAAPAYAFLWFAGIEKLGWGADEPPRSFDLLVNGRRIFTVTTRKDSAASHWEQRSTDGVRLRWDATMQDRAGDLFGMMQLTLPAALCTPGQPLELQLRGERVGSPSWMMTFMHRFRPTPVVRAEPVLLRGPHGPSQLLRVSVDNLIPGSSVSIISTGQLPFSQMLAVGANVFQVPITPARDAGTRSVVVQTDNEAPVKTFLSVAPVPDRSIYLLSYSHNDVGYTDIQPNIERKQWHNLEEGLRLINKTKHYPRDARFQWNMETLWALESYLAQASVERRGEIIQAVRDGALGLNALYVNPLTGLAHSTEMSRFTEFARRFGQQYGLPITTATVSDIPGFTWGIVGTLAQSGVRYFGSAPNVGDRIGFILKDQGDQPFYWVSQSGRDTVLMWVAGASYSTFHEGDITQLGDDVVFKILRRLELRGYPYDIVYLPYTIGGDNGPPDPKLPEFVRAWNDRYQSPRLIIGTHRQMFEAFERRYRSKIPVRRGDLTPYWEDGAASTAFETALSRRASDRLVQSGALWTMLVPQAFPKGLFDAAWNNVVMYDEHTWGASNSVSEPDSPKVREQWERKRQFALNADSLSSYLLASLPVVAHGLPGQENVVDIINTSSWVRTDLVLLPPDQSRRGDRAIDGTGTVLRSQRLSSGELAVLIEDLPGYAKRQLTIEQGRANDGGGVRATQRGLRGNSYDIDVNETGAIQFLRWKGTRIDGRNRWDGFNQYVYVSGRERIAEGGLSRSTIAVVDSGGLVATLLVTGDAPGCRSYSCAIRLVDGIDRIEIVHAMDKAPVRDKEGVHIAFPLTIPSGTIRYDVAQSIVRLQTDQLKGACMNYLSVASWIDCSNSTLGLTCATPDAPLMEPGQIAAEVPWLTVPMPGEGFYSYVMNNYWHTNYKADQEGRVSFRYWFRAHGPFDPLETVRFGREAREPLMVVPGPLPGQAKFRLEGRNLIVQSLEPLDSGRSIVVQLYNPTSEAQHATAFWGSVKGRLRRCDPSGTLLRAGNDVTSVPAHGTVWVRMEVN